MLPDQAIQEYQAIHKKLYGAPLTAEQATKSANQLINLVTLIEGKSYENENEELHANTQ